MQFKKLYVPKSFSFGKVIFPVNPLQPEKALDAIEVKLFILGIEVKLVQFLKQLVPNVCTVDGMVTDLRDAQSSKECGKSVVYNEFLKIIVSKLEQLLKTLLPFKIALFKSIETNLVFFSNAD